MRLLAKKTYINLCGRILSIVLLLQFTVAGVTPSSAFAQEVQDAKTPIILKGLRLDKQDPFRFEFILDSLAPSADAEDIDQDAAMRLVKYFFASLTIPKDDLWVNLSPYEKDRIAPDALSKTHLGQDLLEQDYVLKKMTASLMNPDHPTGAKLWEKIKAKTKQKLGTDDISHQFMNRVWIVPDLAEIVEEENTVIVANTHLTVMLDSDYQDYLNREVGAPADYPTYQEDQTNVHFTDQEIRAIVKEIVIPEIEQAINEDDEFFVLRQIYNSVILAKWYKETLGNTIFNSIYADKGYTDGIDLDDPHVREKLYAKYLASFKEGVFNSIQEEYDPTTQEIVARKYFMGGIDDLQDVNLDSASLSGKSIVDLLKKPFSIFVDTRAEYKGSKEDPIDIQAVGPKKPSKLGFYAGVISSIVAATAGELQLSWKVNDDAYEFQKIHHWLEGQTIADAEVRTVDKFTESYVWDNLPPGTHHFQVSAVDFDYNNGQGYTGWTNSAFGVVADNPNPGPSPQPAGDISVYVEGGEEVFREKQITFNLQGIGSDVEDIRVQVGTERGAADIFTGSLKGLDSFPIDNPLHGGFIFLRFVRELSDGTLIQNEHDIGFATWDRFTSHEDGELVENREETFSFELDEGIEESFVRISNEEFMIVNESIGLDDQLTVPYLPRSDKPFRIEYWGKVNGVWTPVEKPDRTSIKTPLPITFPAPGTLLPREQLFRIPRNPDAGFYWVMVKTLDNKTIDSQGVPQTANASEEPSFYVTDLPSGKPVKIFIWHFLPGGNLQSVIPDTMSFNTQEGDFLNDIVSPMPNDAPLGKEEIFELSEAVGYTRWMEVLQYGEVILSEDIGTERFVPVDGIEEIGGHIQVGLWDYRDGKYFAQEKSFYRVKYSESTALFSKHIISPTPNDAPLGKTETFEFREAIGYERWLKITRGKTVLLSEFIGTERFVPVDGISVGDGEEVIIEIWEYYRDTNTYSAKPAKGVYQTELEFEAPAIYFPTPEMIISGSWQEFKWHEKPGAINYYIEAGSVKGGNDVFDGYVNFESRKMVMDVPDIDELHVRFWWEDANNNWNFEDIPYLVEQDGTLPPVWFPLQGTVMELGQALTFDQMQDPAVLKQDKKLGGIDLNQINLIRSGAAIKVDWKDSVVQFVDPAFSGFEPVIIKIIPFHSQ